VRRRWPAVAGVAALLVAGACSGGDEALPSDTRAPVVETTEPEGAATTTVPAEDPVETVTGVDVGLEEVAELEEPTAMVFRPGREERAYIGERAGVVLDLDLATGDTVALLDLTEETTTDSERGLLGLAVGPDGTHLYVSYTDLDGNTRIEEYAIAADGSLDEDSRRLMFNLDQPFANHNGGHLAFGPDGLLYIGLGDGGAAGDPLRAGQDPEQLLGSILRIDPNGVDGSAYGIPEDNPFVDVEGARPEVWLKGVRNPWRFSFDRATGDLWIGDVGQSEIEEIDLLPADPDGLDAGRGANLGWNAMEGDQPYEDGVAPDDHTPPVFTHPHEDGSCAVIGGHVYQGRIAELFGAYLYSDHCTGELRALAVLDGEVVDDTTIAEVDSPIGFAQDPTGEVYLLTQPGTILKLTPS
jgi:glucose/arabinose dehydrogenase